MKNRIPNAITLLVIFTLLGGGCLILFNSSPVQAARRLPPTEPAPTPAGQGTEINQTDQIDAVAAAISEKVAQQVEAVPAFAIFQTNIEDLRLSDDALWAKALLVPSDPQTGKNFPSEPGLVIARWDGAAWEVVLPSDPKWPAYLQAAPTDLISDEHKAAWQEIYSSAESNQPTNVLRGYLLPWAGGITRNLSQSVSHDLYTPSGSAHYAFDFYTSGQMWDIYAARSGTVWMWQDSVPTCYQPTCNESQPLGNFLVLQDTTTSPTTYQLYLHLAQGSIQAGLKAVGTPVLQGQFLAKADNTGQSWGHHLHFMVHTNPASYWGNSVDISFDDVSINDGRPRTPAEASAYPQYGSQGSTAYTSQNYVVGDPTPPSGDVLDPYSGNFNITNGSLHLAGWATDVGSGVASAQFLAFYNDDWHTVGPAFTSQIFDYDWNLCNSGVPVGPVSLALRVVDYANNQTPPANGLRQGLNNTDCAPTPPACSPAANQIGLFSEPDYGGICKLLSVGNYTNSSGWAPLTDNDIASIKIGSGVRATLYTDEDFGGRGATFTGNDASLVDNLVGVNSASSIRIAARNDPAAVPQPQWPPANSSFTDQESLTLAWRDSGGSIKYEIQIQSGSTTVQSGNASLPYWPVVSLPVGSYSWRVRAANPANDYSNWSGLTPFTITHAAESPASYTLPITDTFETQPIGWETSGSWSWSSDPGQARSASHAWVFSPTTVNEVAAGSLTTPEIPIPESGYFFTFYYRYHTETDGLLWDQRWVQVSKDGSPFQDLLQLSDDPPDAWLRSPFVDLSAYAGSTIRLRFYFHSLDQANNETIYWDIDDLTLAKIQLPACPGEGEPDNSPATARPLSPNIPASGTICPAGDVDYYKFTISQPGTALLANVDAQVLGSPLDAHLTLYDGDGLSILAIDDDEIPYLHTDSRLGYIFTRAGTYYLKLKPWNYPEAGGPSFTYRLTLNSQPLVQMFSPVSLNALQMPDLELRVLANDNGGVVDHVGFWWHDNNWIGSPWQLVGFDADGSDGWSLPFNPGSLTDRVGLAFYAIVFDRNGGQTATAAWEVALDRAAPHTSLLPPSSPSTSTAVYLSWNASDNLAGMDHYDLQSKAAGSPNWATQVIENGKKHGSWVIGEPGKTYVYRLRGVDRANNSESFPPDPEASIQFLACTRPDTWDSSGSGDNSDTSATTLSLGAVPQVHNFCQTGDQDWYTFQLPAGSTVDVMGQPMDAAAATKLTLYRKDGNQLTLLGQAQPPAFGTPAVMAVQSTGAATYYLKVTHVDERVAGDTVTYRIALGTASQSYFPVINR